MIICDLSKTLFLSDTVIQLTQEPNIVLCVFDFEWSQ